MQERVRAAPIPHTEAAAVAGEEAGDNPARNCGTAAAVSTAAAIWQEGHTHWLGEVKTTADLLCLETYAGDTNSSNTKQNTKTAGKH